MGFVGEMRTITAIVLVKSCDDGIGIGCHILVDGCFLSIEPVANELLIEWFLGALVRTDVEVGIAEGGAVETGFHPVVVHAEGTQHQVLVMATDEMVEGLDFVGTQVEENRIDELYHVVVPELGHGTQDVEKVTERVHLPQRPTAQIDIAAIVLPTVAIAHDTDFVSECSQALGQCPMYVAIIAEK